jgi:hypothetical protein
MVCSLFGFAAFKDTPDLPLFVGSNFYRRNDTPTIRLSPPKQVTWFVALVLAILALLSETKVIAALTPYSFWIAIIAAALLLLATMVDGL